MRGIEGAFPIVMAFDRLYLLTLSILPGSDPFGNSPLTRLRLIPSRNTPQHHRTRIEFFQVAHTMFRGKQTADSGEFITKLRRETPLSLPE